MTRDQYGGERESSYRRVLHGFAPRGRMSSAALSSKIALYAQTVLKIGPEARLTIDVQQPVSDFARQQLIALGLPKTFAVITACNPRGRQLSDRQNRWRHLLLRLMMMVRGRMFVAADGLSPDGFHREAGVAVEVGRDSACRIARNFGQLALYWFDGEAFWLDGALVTRPAERLPRHAPSGTAPVTECRFD